MPATMNAMGIDQLSVPERLALVQDIWDSIAEDSERARCRTSRSRRLISACTTMNAILNPRYMWEQVEARRCEIGAENSVKYFRSLPF